MGAALQIKVLSGRGWFLWVLLGPQCLPTAPGTCWVLCPCPVEVAVALTRCSWWHLFTALAEAGDGMWSDPGLSWGHV